MKRAVIVAFALACQPRDAGLGPGGPRGPGGVATVLVTPGTSTIAVSAMVQLVATPRDSGGQDVPGSAVEWTTSSAAVATVTPTGAVQGMGVGNATIRATVGGKTGQATVTVTNIPIDSVAVAPPSASVLVGATVQLTATPLDAAGLPLSGRTISWRSSDSSRARVSNTGLVTGRVIGSATIIASSEGRVGTASISVTQVPVASLIVSPSSASVFPAGTRQLTATARDANGATLSGRPVTWRSSDTTKVRVNGTGLITGVGIGTAAVTATCEGQTATASIEVKLAPVATVQVTPSSTSVGVSATVQLSATLRDANGTTLTGRTAVWSSGDTSRAQVSSTGMVLGVAAGPVTITASSEGQSGTASITVTAPPAGTTLFTESFDNTLFGNRGWYDLGSPTISTIEKRAGTASLEARWTTSGNTAYTSTVGTMRRLFTPTSSLYVSYWVKYSTNYVGSGRAYHPHEFMILSTREDDYSPLASNYLNAYIEQNYQNGGIPRLMIQDNRMIDITKILQDLTGITENRSVGGCNGNTDGTGSTECWQVSATEWYNAKQWSAPAAGFRPTAGTDYKADWNHVEVFFQLNTVAGGIGQPNGIVRYWLNGNLKIEHTNVLFRTGANATLQFKQFVFGPYIGDGSPVQQTMWVDDLTVGTARP